MDNEQLDKRLEALSLKLDTIGYASRLLTNSYKEYKAAFNDLCHEVKWLNKLPKLAAIPNLTVEQILGELDRHNYQQAYEICYSLLKRELTKGEGEYIDNWKAQEIDAYTLQDMGR